MIDRYAYTSPLAVRHPAEKGLLVLLALTACLVARAWWVPLLVGGIMVLLTLRVAGTPWRVYLRLLLVPTFFMAAGLPAVALSAVTGAPPEGQWVAVGQLSLGVTHEGLAMAREILGRALGSVTCLYFLALSTPLVDLTGFLRRCGVPALFLEVLTLVYRFVFVLLETAWGMHRAQTLRLGYVDPATGFRSLGGLLANLLLRSQQRARALFVALTLRGYEGQLEVLTAPRRLSAGNLLMATGLGGGFLMLALLVPAAV